MYGSAAVLTSAMLLGMLSDVAQAQDAAVEVKVSIDARKESDRATSKVLDKLSKLTNHALVCLDVRVTADGSQPAAILTSNEGDMRRYPVDCRRSQLGSFPMASSVEYYLPAIGKVGKAELDVEVYPGGRTDHPFNDVSCIASSEGGNAAVFHITGFYVVRKHDFGERQVVEFRPATGKGVSREAASACLQ